jgi:Ca2+-binding EF-hand superfamily protein
VFITRVFQECLTYGGEMDYKSYLDFVLALENRNSPQGLRYLFHIMDVDKKGYLHPGDLNFFYRVQISFRLSRSASTIVCSSGNDSNARNTTIGRDAAIQ